MKTVTVKRKPNEKVLQFLHRAICTLTDTGVPVFELHLQQELYDEIVDIDALTEGSSSVPSIYQPVNKQFQSVKGSRLWGVDLFQDTSLDVNTVIVVSNPQWPEDSVEFPQLQREKIVGKNTRSKYVVGFAFDKTETSLLLILKAKPDWQKGRWNGIGGSIEDGETPLQAMNREWNEEVRHVDLPSGTPPHVNWTPFVVLQSATRNSIVYYFRGNTEISTLNSSSEDEPIRSFSLKQLPKNLIFDCKWLIAMAAVEQHNDWVYHIEEGYKSCAG